MKSWRLAQMSDPALNTQFRRRWTGPPPKRKRGPRQRAALTIYVNSNEPHITMNNILGEEAARWAADRLGIDVVLQLEVAPETTAASSSIDEVV